MPTPTPKSGHLRGRAVYVIDGCRTPFLKARGEPGPFTAAELALHAAKALHHRTALEPELLDQVILGCVGPAADEANIARIVALRLGCAERTPAWSVQRNCASGLQALDSAALEIASGRSELILAGGTEAMSHAPVQLNALMLHWLAAWNRAHSLRQRGQVLLQLRTQHLHLVIALLRGLTDPVTGLNMGQTAEQLASDFGIERQAMDRFALQSHQRLAQAQSTLDEIEPLFDHNGQSYSSDDGLRPDSSLEALARLKPVFDRQIGRVSAANSAQISDGAAVLLLASAAAVKRYGLPVLGQIIDSHWAGLAPQQMGLGPVHAMAPLLQRQQLCTDEIDYWEINEAFAAQVLACLKAWESPDYCREQLGLDQPHAAIDVDKLNLDGGGISLGHPVGASGARIVLHALKRLQQQDQNLAMASLCIGGGQGGAMLLQNVHKLPGKAA